MKETKSLKQQMLESNCALASEETGNAPMFREKSRCTKYSKSN